MKKSVLFSLLLLTLHLSANTKDEEYLKLLRQKMVKEQIKNRNIYDPQLIRVFLKVKRHLFVKPELQKQAYNDIDLPIDEGQSIISPYIMAVQTLALNPTGKNKILEIGTGSGYQTAILAELCKEVYTIEINDQLFWKAQQLLSKLGYKNIKFMNGNGYLGWPEYAPFDGIIITCSPDKIPKLLIEQLTIGGRMIIPITYDHKVQELIMIEKLAKGKLKKTYLISVSFSPMIEVENAK